MVSEAVGQKFESSPTHHYVYTDRMAGPVLYVTHGLAVGRASHGVAFDVHEGAVIFECDATDILEADKLLLAATGLVASKETNICCDVK